MLEQEEKFEKKGRGRPKKNEHGIRSATGNYFNDFEESIVLYNTLTDQSERDKLFRTKMYYPLWYMCQTILRKYYRSRGFPINETDEELIINAMSFVIGIIDKFDPIRGYKAYSYIQTVIKHHYESLFRGYFKLHFKQEPTGETTQRSYNIDEVKDIMNKESGESETEHADLISQIIGNTIMDIDHAIKNKSDFDLNDNDCFVGTAIINILANHDEILNESNNNTTNKFNKSIILCRISDMTLLDPKIVKASLKKYKEIYKRSKRNLLAGYD